MAGKYIAIAVLVAAYAAAVVGSLAVPCLVIYALCKYCFGG